jgi:pilus assembly protein FimV
MNNRGRWRFGALASAIALLGSLASLEAHALALGRITVQSALGEPLRAEIDIADIKPDEAASLKAGVAPPDTFKAAGLEYGSVAAGVEVSLQRRADGRSFLRLSSSRPVTEPFVDLILEASWANGRITRDYTMLFDPPALRSSGAGSAVAPTAPILSRPLPPAPPAKGIASIPYSPSTATRPAPVAKAPPASLEKIPAGGDKQVTVKAGDTAGKIAAQNKPASVSLDQMLVALLRSNPDAFIGGNINRVKSGAVLDIPSAETASAISSSEASQTIVAQSKDFNTFRRKLAEGVQTTQTAGADRQAGGKVQAKVEDRAPASTTPDKLTLSKGAVQGKAASATEDKIAKERQAKEASARVAELSKNISDLNKLGGAPSAAAPAAGAKAPGVAVPAPSVAAVPAPAVPTSPAPAPAATPAPAAAAAPAVAASAATTTPAAQGAGSGVPAVAAAPESAASSSVAPLAAASQPASAASDAAAVVAAPVVKKKAAQPPPPPPEPSLIDELLENPLVLPIAGGILLLLAGFGFYRYRQRGSSAQVDSSFLESRLQPDSFFGASGGQRIDTNESNVTGSSLVYSPSQLDAAGDVDPVAEADVYLAYGRDLQAEEILKEAMRTSPMRVAIHAKLMEIYAKRRDSKAFETVAVEAFNLTHGNGPEWAYITEMGRELDPANPMYQPGGQPAGATFNPGGTLAMNTQPAPIAPMAAAPAAPSVDVDLDLDFSLGDEPEVDTAAAAIAPLPLAPAPAPAPRPPEPTVAMKPQPAAVMEMDFGSATVALPTAAAAPAAKPAELDASFLDDGLNFTPEPFTPPPKPVATAAKAAPAAAADSGMLEFDLGSLSLDLNGPTTESPAPVAMEPSSDSPLETKFLLAEEFRSLGDTDGARSLAEEVLAEASGPLKVKAQAFLNALS